MRTQRITATDFMSSFSSPARSSVDDLDDLDDLGDFLTAPTDHPRDADGRVIPMTLQEQADATGIPIEELN